MLIGLLIGIGIGVGFAAALLTYRQCHPTNTNVSDSQRQDALERFKIWNNFWKYFLVSFALVLITTLLSNKLKDRELLIAENDNLGKFLERVIDDDYDRKINFASYFRYLTRDAGAQQRWKEYVSFLQESHKQALEAVDKQKANNTALADTTLDRAKRTSLEKEQRDLQADLDLYAAVLGRRVTGPFDPGCELPFKGIKNPAIDDQCGIEGGSTDPANQAESRVANNFCAGMQGLHEITFNDFVNLQTKAANVPKRVINRSVLTALGEGRYVSYICFIKGAHYSDTARGEAKNCNLPGPAANDLHIDLVTSPNEQDLCNSTTAEISPHYRPSQWTPENLLAASSNHPIRIRGQLFYDGSHMPCSGESRPNPKRISVWEIHPVYSIEICSQATITECNSPTAKWTLLQ